jgi:hypothetical protein
MPSCRNLGVALSGVSARTARDEVDERLVANKSQEKRKGWEKINVKNNTRWIGKSTIYMVKKWDIICVVFDAVAYQDDKQYDVKDGYHPPLCFHVLSNPSFARITIIAQNRACVFVQFAVDIRADWMIAQIKVGSVYSWVPAPDNVQRNLIIMAKSWWWTVASLQYTVRCLKCVLCRWTAATRLHRSKICKLVLFQSLVSSWQAITIIWFHKTASQVSPFFSVIQLFDKPRAIILQTILFVSA